MPRPSTVDQLPEEIRSEIGRLRAQGATIDRIVEHLRGLYVDVSRSAVGRHVKSMAAMGEKMRRSRQVAEALVRELGDAPESRAARLNIELLHTAILDLHMRSADGEQDVDADGTAALAGNPEGLMLLSKAIDHLTKSSRADQDFRTRIEQREAERVKKAAAGEVERIGRERGISADSLAAVKAGIFGIGAAP
jgi:hypothetical protein